jgi:hypothetical protein
MLIMYHSKDITDLNTAVSLTGGPNPERPALAYELFLKGYYEAVASADVRSDFIGQLRLLKLTQNRRGRSWSRYFSDDLLVADPIRAITGIRESQTGDIIEEQDERGHIAMRWVVDLVKSPPDDPIAWMVGFTPMPGDYA